MVETFAQLYEKLDVFFRGIEQDCSVCKDPDCMGYVWLLREEANQLYDRGIPLVQVNNGPTFIHSFSVTAEGIPKLSVRYPACSQLCVDTGLCSIHEDRPLVCRLYPLGLETTTDGRIVWVVHLDCLYMRRLQERNQLPDFKSRACSLINGISSQLLVEILETYQAVDAISAFPEGENNYTILKEAFHVKV